MATSGFSGELAKSICILEEAYGTAPLLWSPSLSDPKGSTSFTQSEIDDIHAVVIYAISPFMFKRPYCHDDLNRFAKYVDLLPRNGETFFDPERHNPRKEHLCCRLISFAQNITLFAFNALKKGHLNMLAAGIFQDRYNIPQCISYAKDICNHIFGGAMNPEKAFLGLFVIVISLVHDSDRFTIITQTLKQPDDTPDSVELSKNAKQFVKCMNYEDALKTYKEILKTRSYDHYIYGNLAQVYLSLEEFLYAEWCAQRAIMLNPKWPKSHYRWIRAVECQGNVQKAYEVSSAITHLAETVPDFFKGGVDLIADLYNQQQDLFTKALHVQVSTIESEKAKKYPKYRNRVPSTSSTKSSSGNGQKSSSSAVSSMANASTKTDSDMKADCSHTETSHVSKAEAGKSKADPDAAKKKGVRDNYVNLVKGASEALIAENFKVAFLKYSMALDIYKEKGLKGLGISVLDIILLKYCFALTCIGKGTYEDIDIGLQALHEIIDDHYNIAFPLAYYGKARCFTTLNRYNEAKDPLEKLKNIIDKKIKLEVYEYPCYDGMIITESHPGKLKNLVDDLLATCSAPPAPNAICRHTCDTSHFKREIYYNDPDFQGYAEVICQERCHLQYHLNCWKETKEEHKIPREKDFIGKQCMTPDCCGTVIKIELYGADGVIRKMFSGEPEVKPKVKEQSSHVKPIKENKKLSRPYVKQRSREISENSIDDGHLVEKLPDCLNPECNNEAKNASFVSAIQSMPDMRKDAYIVFKKLHTEDTNTILDKKPHQKKQKHKQLLHLEFENSDATRIQQLKNLKQAAENANPSNKIAKRCQRPVMLDPVLPFAIPSVKDDFALEKWLQSVDKDQQKEKEGIEENLIEYLENYLKTNGPTSLISSKFISEMSDFPTEAQLLLAECGGIQKFLLNSKRFEFISDILLLPKHFYVLTWDSTSFLWVLDLAVQGCNPRNTLWSSSYGFQPLIKAVSLPWLLDNASPPLPNDYFLQKFTISVEEFFPNVFGLYNARIPTKNGARFRNNYNISNSSHSSCSDLLTSDGHRDRSTSASTSTDISNVILEPNRKISTMDTYRKENYGPDILAGKAGSYVLPTKITQTSHPYGASMAGTCHEINLQQKSFGNDLKPTKSSEKVANTSSLKKEPMKSESLSSVDCEVNTDGHCLHCEEMEILKQKYDLTTDQCQDLKDKLTQKQNELQMLKATHKGEIDDKDERFKKMQKRFDILQSNHDKTCKQMETEKNKYNSEIKSLNDKIKLLATDKESIVSEGKEAQQNLHELVILREEQLESEKRLRKKAEDELKTVKDVLETMRVDYNRSSNNERVLTEKARDLEIQINNLNKKLASEHMRNQQHRSAFIEPVPHPVPQWTMPTPRYYPVPRYSESMLGPYPVSATESFRNGRPWLPPQPNFPSERQNIQGYSLHTDAFRSNSTSDLTKVSFGIPFGHHSQFQKRGSSPNPVPPSFDSSSPSSSSSVSESPTRQISKPSNSQDNDKQSNQVKDHCKKATHPEDDQCLPSESASKTASISYAECAAITPNKKNKIAGPVGKFKEILEALQKEFPTLTQSEFTKYILEVRARHNKTLSGMKMRTILDEVRSLIRTKLSASKDSSAHQNRLSALKSTSSSVGPDKFIEVPLAWNILPQTKNEAKRFHSDECYICLEKMAESNSEFLPCGHVYHHCCIKQWFDKNSTCPICREHSLLPKEFPPLK